MRLCYLLEKEKIMKYIRCILLLLLITGESYGGSGASKVFLGVGLGVATGGAGFALGATAGTAVTAGLATTAGVIAGADTRALCPAPVKLYQLRARNL